MIKKVFTYIKRAKYITSVKLKFAVSAMFPSQKKQTVDNFHKLFYDSHIVSKTWNDSYFLGVGIQKCPFDLFIYQEIIYELKPDLIIETGTEFGGSAYYMAIICDALKKGKIITVDIKQFKNKPKHERITYLTGSSIDKTIITKMKSAVRNKKKILVILDSDHSRDHVLQELQIYSAFVSKGSYLIVEDSNVNGHPVYSDHGPGPMEAIQGFMKNNKNFKIDKSREKLYLTFNPNGYLKKIA